MSHSRCNYIYFTTHYCKVLIKMTNLFFSDFKTKFAIFLKFQMKKKCTNKWLSINYCNQEKISN